MLELLTLSASSLALAGSVYYGFKQVDSLATKKLKEKLKSWIASGPKTNKFKSLNEIPFASDIRIPTILENTIYATGVFLVLIILLNLTYSVVGDFGVLRDSDEVGLEVNPVNLEYQIEVFSRFNSKIGVDSTLIVQLLGVIVILFLILLLPAYINLLVTRYFVKHLTNNNESGALILATTILDLIIKSTLSILIPVISIALLVYFSGNEEFTNTVDYYRKTWIESVQFDNENTIVQAAFIGSIYINIWIVIYYLSILLSRMFHYSSAFKRFLIHFDIDNKPFSVIGLFAGLLVFFIAETGVLILSES